MKVAFLTANLCTVLSKLTRKTAGHATHRQALQIYIIGEKTSWELPAGRLRRSWEDNTKTVVR
jgi:hypothetical protein